MSIFVDNTILSAVARCDTEAVVQHGLGLAPRDEGVRLRAGIDAHAALAEFLRGANASRALATFDMAYASYSSEHIEPHVGIKPSLAAYTRKNLSDILLRWFETHPLHLLPFKATTDLVEVPFQVPLDDDGEFVFCGTADAIVTDDSGALWVLDHKTTGSLTPAWGRKFILSSQMSGYVWAAEQTLGQRVTGVFINAIEFKKLPDSDRACPEHKGMKYSACGLEHARSEILTFSRSAEQLDAWRRDALGLALRYRDLLERTQYEQANGLIYATATVQQGTFNNSCAYCSFADWCEAGRPAASLETLYEVNRWNPQGRGA